MPSVRSFDVVFGNVAYVASESVVIELLKTKCLPILYYGLKLAPLVRCNISH